jgi:hypothetical protein
MHLPQPKPYSQIPLTPDQKQLLWLRRQLSAPESRLPDKLRLWSEIIELESGMDERVVKMISRLVATEA